MSSPDDNPPRSAACRALSARLLQSLYGDAAGDTPPEVCAHLLQCAACRAEADAARAVLALGAEALAPQPLTPALRATIEARLAELRPAQPKRILRHWLGVTGLAAAAVLLLALVWRNTSQSPARNSAAGGLSAAEAAALAHSYGLLEWEAPADFSMDAFAATLQKTQRAVELGQPPRLPWTSEDNWDAPSAPSQSGAQRRSGPLVTAGFSPVPGLWLPAGRGPAGAHVRSSPAA